MTKVKKVHIAQNQFFMLLNCTKELLKCVFAEVLFPHGETSNRYEWLDLLTGLMQEETDNLKSTLLLSCTE